MEIEKPTSVGKQNKSNSFSILLIEDDEIDIMNIKRAFAKNNISNPLFIAKNGIEALELLGGISDTPGLNPMPSVILLDINMPKMSGLEFLRILRNEPNFRMISVFVMTTSNEDSDRFEAYSLNVAGYILKPLSFENFTAAIKTLNNYWNLTSLP